jgi:hypothetical protein
VGAIKEAITTSIESVLIRSKVEIEGQEVLVFRQIKDVFENLVTGDNQGCQALENQWFETMNIDAADFLADWLHGITAAVAIYTGLATTDDGLIGNSFAHLAYQFHLHPRRVAVAMMRAGLNDKAIQAILYLLSGVILDQNDKLKIVRFDYLNH